MIIQVDPLDTLFFRDGKPFSMGNDSWANSVFPPYPSVIYGALRSTYFSEHIHKLKMANTPEDPTKNLKITGIYFSIHNEIYLPLPFDCVQEKDSPDENAFCLPLVSQQNVKTSSPVHHYLKSKTPVKKIKRGLLPINSLKKYLSDTISEIPFCKIPDCVMIEPKIGISINRETGSAEKTNLYNAFFFSVLF
jgi:CRISPR-associated protein Cmr3